MRGERIVEVFQVSTLSTLWGAAGNGYLRHSGIVAVIAAHDTMATGMGYTRTVTSAPSTWDASTPASTVDAWENWYNGVAARSGLPPTTVIDETAATGAPWNELANTAQQRNAPAAVRAFFAVIGGAWNDLRGAVLPSTVYSTLLPGAITGSERAEQAWWQRRLGGAAGPMTPFVDASGAQVPAPSTPSTPGGSTPSTPGGGMVPMGGETITTNGELAMYAVGAYAAYKLFFSEGRRGRRGRR